LIALGTGRVGWSCGGGYGGCGGGGGFMPAADGRVVCCCGKVGLPGEVLDVPFELPSEPLPLSRGCRPILIVANNQSKTCLLSKSAAWSDQRSSEHSKAHAQCTREIGHLPILQANLVITV
jgi:hypothetical protein